MNGTAVDTEGAWFDPEEMAQLRRRLPIASIEAVPVRTDVDGSITEVGLLLRADGNGRIVRSLVAGRVLVHEGIREAIIRHMEKDLGPLAMPRVPVSITPFTVAEFFPSPSPTAFVDERQHAIVLAYIVPVDGECEPQQDALDFTWFAAEEIASSGALEEMEDGHDIIVRRALAVAGIL